MDKKYYVYMLLEGMMINRFMLVKVVVPEQKHI